MGGTRRRNIYMYMYIPVEPHGSADLAELLENKMHKRSMAHREYQRRGEDALGPELHLDTNDARQTGR